MRFKGTVSVISSNAFCTDIICLCHSFIKGDIKIIVNHWQTVLHADYIYSLKLYCNMLNFKMTKVINSFYLNSFTNFSYFSFGFLSGAQGLPKNKMKYNQWRNGGRGEPDFAPLLDFMIMDHL